MEQDYEIYNENQTISVRSNELLLKEILYCVKTGISTLLEVMDSNCEMFERKEIVGYYCLYSLYRRLIPQHIQPEEKVLTLLWKLHKKMPVVVVGQNAVCDIGMYVRYNCWISIVIIFLFIFSVTFFWVMSFSSLIYKTESTV